MKNDAARKLKQVPSDYLIIGVDPHKKTHAAAAMTYDMVSKRKDSLCMFYPPIMASMSIASKKRLADPASTSAAQALFQRAAL